MENVYKNIIESDRLSAKDKAKRFIYYYNRRRGAEKSWVTRHEKLFAIHNSYYESCDSKVESIHQNLWSVFRKKVNMDTLRICKNISGESDARIIPEDIFVSDIEPALITDESCHFFSHKSFYNRWFPAGTFPEDLLHCIEGQYLDADLNQIDMDEFSRLVHMLPYPVVIKPNTGTFGGKDVFFIKSAGDLIPICKRSQNFVVQKEIKQHSFFRKYNPVGLNTIRVYVYKSVIDNRTHVLNMALRMGQGGSLDNETSGGIHTLINSDGVLNGYAVDKYGKHYSCHPDTGLSFEDQIPSFPDLKDLAKRVADQVFFTRLIGLDMCYDQGGRWRVIEVNTKGHTIRFSQYGGQPFFGKFTEEIIDHCQRCHWTLSDKI